jgi:hypothetical protein
MSIGSTYATDQEYLLPAPVTDSEASSSFDSSEVSDSDKVEWEIDAIESEIDVRGLNGSVLQCDVNVKL